MTTIESDIESTVNASAQLFNSGRRADASVALLHALTLTERIESQRDRREHLGTLAGLFANAGFEELALMAKADQIAISEALGETQVMGRELITLANLFHGIGNHEVARRLNQRALDIGTAESDPEMAVAASTNLATHDMIRKNFTVALPKLEESLRLLSKIKSPRNEMITRAMLVQALDQLETDHERALQVARPLFGRLRSLLNEEQLKELTEVVERVAQRYLDAKPETDGTVWKSSTLPELWEA